MLTSSISIGLGITFVLVGAINVWLILQASVRAKNAKTNSRFIAAHRIGGYSFIVLFCVMGYFMVARMGDIGGDAPAGTMIHLTLALILGPLLFVKVLVARYYKSYYSFLLPIGLVIFVLAFVLIGIIAGPYFADRARMMQTVPASADQPQVAMDINIGAAKMEKRCSKCHTLDRIAGARKDAQGWLTTVNRMRAMPDSGISEEESRTILSYLVSQMAPREPAGTEGLAVARALVDQKCGRCHSLDRVYKTAQAPEEWRATVNRMVGFAEGSSNAFQPGEDEQIVVYLSAMQTPEAVNQRKSRVEAASSTGRSMVTQKISAALAALEQPVAHRGYDGKMIAFIALVCLGALALMIRRPGKNRAASSGSSTYAQASPTLAGSVPVADASPGGALILRLASITQQTHDAKTLRFTVADEQKVKIRPGQFLTFSFLFDGKKITRSYSICSSAARPGYVEITPKRTNQGCVSVFLNERASVGMTVEAKGPFGSFCFDESRHNTIVLLAAGSGITPLRAMLRYMDDLCLETNVILLYCVRTSNDVIFASELEQLSSRLKNFRYHILLSQPHAEWPGPRGHISREFIENTVEDAASRDFFLCGPPPFMDASRDILTKMGIKPERIRQESFGSTTPQKVQQAPAVQTGVVTEFVRSGKTCMVRSGQTILEAAEEHGVPIPSSCRQGQCGTCKTKLLEGDVQMDAEEGLDADSKAQGFVLTCVGHARGLVKLDA
jgi:ferredoxin-NADP reductase